MEFIFLIIVVIVLYLLIKYIFNKQSNESNESSPSLVSVNNDDENTNIKYSDFYVAKQYINTINEIKFYQILLTICKELDLIVFSQVSLYNIVSVKKDLSYSEYTKYFNKISSKTIDFVLVEKNTCKILLCIELDDSTHYHKQRIERDNFINKLFSELNINFLRYPVYKVYYKDVLKKCIEEKINTTNETKNKIVAT